MTLASRRELLSGGAAASLAPLLVHVSTAFAATNSDAEVIAAAVGVEQVAMFAYDAALKSNLLDATATKTAQLFLAHETQHRDALTVPLQRLGGKAPPPPAGPRANKLLAPLTTAKSQKDILTIAVAVETAALVAYYDAHGRLQAPELLRTVAEIMANEGQHLVVLRTALGAAPAPNAFETGSPSQ